MTVALHHAAICTSDVETALRLWRDGMGLQQQFDQVFAGRWPELFSAPTGELRSLFLGDPQAPESGIVELVVFEGAEGQLPPAARPRHGFFLLSFLRDPEETLARLADLGFADDVRRIRQPAGESWHVPMAVVTAPDGVLVELIGTVLAGPA